MSSFPKAQLKRFNDVEPHGQSRGEHNLGLTPYSSREAVAGAGRLNRSLCPEPLARIQPQPRRLISKTAKTPLSSSCTVARTPGHHVKPAQPCEDTVGLGVEELGRRLASVQEELARERSLRQQRAYSYDKDSQQAATFFHKERDNYQKKGQEEAPSFQKEREDSQKVRQEEAASIQKEKDDCQKSRKDMDTTHRKDVGEQEATHKKKEQELTIKSREIEDYIKEVEDYKKEIDDCKKMIKAYKKEREEQTAVCTSLAQQLAVQKSEAVLGCEREEHLVGQLEMVTRELEQLHIRAREKKAEQEKVEEKPTTAAAIMLETPSGTVCGGDIAANIVGENMDMLRVAQLEQAPKSGSKMDFGEKKIFFQEKIQADVGSPSFRKRTEG